MTFFEYMRYKWYWFTIVLGFGYTTMFFFGWWASELMLFVIIFVVQPFVEQGLKE